MLFIFYNNFHIALLVCCRQMAAQGLWCKHDEKQLAISHLKISPEGFFFCAMFLYFLSPIYFGW